MSSSLTSWKNVPNFITNDIMLMAGLGSLQDLHKCRQVCQSWNVIISQQMTRKDQIWSKAENLAGQIKKNLNDGPLLHEIFNAASLAHHRMLRSVRYLDLRDITLATVTTEELVSLTSSVERGIKFRNVSNFDLVRVLDSINCKWLNISRQTLSSEATQALVRAMQSHVESVYLGEEGEVDITMTQYSGHGKCKGVTCYGETADRYREEVKTWAQMMNWYWRLETGGAISIMKNGTCETQ